MPITNDTSHAFLPYPDATVPNAPAGPLSGLSFGVTDLFDVAGYPTGGGQPFVLAMSGIKSHSAPVVQDLLDAGARFVGKTVTDELAFSMNGNNAHFGAPVNGAAADRIAGGSSSGSASAVSNRLCDFALGSDTGGSVRAPANHCGLYGIRPTHGRISLEGALPLSPSLDTCGYFARDIDTFVRVSATLLRADTKPLPEPVRLLKPLDIWGLLADEVAAAQAQPLARVQSSLGPARGTQIFLDNADTAYWSLRRIQGYEAWAAHGAFIERFCPPLGPGIDERFAWSKNVTEAQYAEASAYRQRFTKHLADVLGSDGVLVMPTTADIAPLIGETGDKLESFRNRSIQMLCVAGLSGFPQVSLPLGQRLGAPLGLSLLGPAGSDMSLVRLAQRITGQR
ncbi:MAG: amidase [Betaproteobacteria bacterium]